MRCEHPCPFQDTTKNTTLKYWLLTTEYPPFYGGGISTYCYHTARMLAEKQHQVTVFIPDDEVQDYIISHSEGIRLVRFNTNRTGAGNFLGHTPALSYEFAIMVRDLVRKEGKPDYIESQEYLALPYYLLQFKLLGYPEFTDVPVVLTLHSPAFLYLLYNREGVYEFPNYWTGEMEKSCIVSADLVIAPSRYMIDEIKKHTNIQIEAARLAIIRNPYVVPAEAAHQKITRNRVVFFGKLSPQKGVFELFAYFRDMWDRGFKHSLTVIGGTEKVYYPEMKTMGQLIEDKYKTYFEKGLVELKGRIHPSEKETYLADAHVILIPSMNDNLPYAAIEAMSMGKVVLASKQGGHSEIIEDGKQGFLFDHNIPGDFEKKLNEVLALHDDALVQTGQAARVRIQELLRYETIYEEKIKALQGITTARRTIFPFTTDIQAGTLTGTSLQPGLLSVIIPFYNLGGFIRETVDSVMASAYPNKEILIINDGSTDTQSLQVLQELEKLPGIQVVHKKNEGLAESRNHGARLARGQFMAFLDADDKVHPEYYSRAIGVLQQYDNVFFAGAWVQYFGRKKSIWPTWNPEPPYFLIHNSVNSSALVYKTAAFLQAGFNDKLVDYGIEDYESVVNLLKNGFRGVVFPECLFYYRIRHNSMYRAITRHKILYSYSYIAQKHAVLYNQFAPDIFNLINANGPSFAFDNPSLPVKVTSRILYPHAIVNKLKKAVKRNTRLKKLLLRLNNRFKFKQV